MENILSKIFDYIRKLQSSTFISFLIFVYIYKKTGPTIPTLLILFFALNMGLLILIKFNRTIVNEFNIEQYLKLSILLLIPTIYLTYNNLSEFSWIQYCLNTLLGTKCLFNKPAIELFNLFMHISTYYMYIYYILHSIKNIITREFFINKFEITMTFLLLSVCIMLISTL